MIRRHLALWVLLLGMPAPAALAQIDVTWDNCILADTQNGEPLPTGDKTFVCTELKTFRLHGSFKSPVDIPDFFALEMVFDLQQETEGNLVPFYHYESGGCNASGIALIVGKDASGAGGDGNACALLDTPWGERGEAAEFAGITAYAPDFTGSRPYPGWGHLAAAIARSWNDVFILHAYTNYYAFHMTWTTGNSAVCPGCGTRAVVVWTYALLHGSSGQTVLLTGPSNKGPLATSSVNSYCATIQGASLQTCAATPTRNTTWGQLKSIYR